MRRTMIAPLVVTILMILELLVYLVIFLFIPIWPVRIVVGIAVLALIGVCIHVLRERIHEIRSGEEDDLGEY